MKTRIIVGACLSAFLVLLLYFGGYVLLTGLSLISFGAVYEVAHVIRKHGGNPVTIPSYIFALLFGFVYRLGDLLLVWILFWACLTASVICLICSPKRTSADAIVTMFLVLYPTVLLVCMMLTYFSFERPVGLTAACLAYAAPACADSFAYFGGTWFGKRKLCPRISPKKTVAGAYAAVIGSLGFSIFLYFFQAVWQGTVPFPALIFIGLFVGIFAQAGDLFASMLKRWAEVKDFSSVFPGHGGIMDRIDSILLSAPFVLTCFVIMQRIGIY